MITSSAENFNLSDLMSLNSTILSERLELFHQYYLHKYANMDVLFRREVVENHGREALVKDPYTGVINKMLMFGSNNYLGIANHPGLLQKISDNFDKYGTGLGGPPLLNGNTSLHVELEGKLAKLKNKQESLIFSSGFAANYGLCGALFNKSSIVLFDELSHASFIDGLLMSRVRFKTFKHNDIKDLENKLEEVSGKNKDIFVATEGVFSMDGDLGKIDDIIKLKSKYSFYLVVDDAHGLGVVGENGHGIHEHFQTDEIDFIMGTFSKTLAAAGGFLAADSRTINYMRYFTRSYMFSAALPPSTISMVLAGLDILDNDKWRVQKLRKNVKYLINKLENQGIHTRAESAIVTVVVPEDFNILKANKELHDEGLFVNTVEYPAVAQGLERFRISLMSEHTENDIDKLVGSLAKALKLGRTVEQVVSGSKNRDMLQLSDS